MINRVILSIVIVGLLTSCQNKRDFGKKITQNIVEISDSLNMELNEIERKSIIPGFSVAIVNDKNIVYSKGFGYSNLKDSTPFTSQSINNIASISKTFIGVAILKLVELGVLDLDEKINDILAYQVINPHFPEKPITVRHLVTHTAGLTDDFDPEDVGEAHILLLEEINYKVDSIQKIMDKELSYYKLGVDLSLDEVMQRYLTKGGKWYSENNYENFEPGTKYSYSNMGAELASVIVEKKSGMSFDKFTKKYIFDPLEMNNTGWFYSDIDSNLLSKIYFPNKWEKPTVAIEHPKYHSLAYSSGDLKTNMNDLSKFLIDMINGSNGKGELLNKEAYDMLFTPSLDSLYFAEARDKSPLNDEYNVGVFWAVSSTGLRLHNGAQIGVYSFMYFDPITKSGAIGFCNLPDRSFGEIRDVVYKYERKLFNKNKKASR